MKILFKKAPLYTYIFPTILFSKSDWKHNMKRVWIAWLNFEICLIDEKLV